MPLVAGKMRLCCEPTTAGCTLIASCGRVALESGYHDPAASCLAAYDEEYRPCAWRAGRCAAADDAICPHAGPPPPAYDGARPHVVLVMTDQQALWTVAAYHRQLRRGRSTTMGGAGRRRRRRRP